MVQRLWIGRIKGWGVVIFDDISILLVTQVPVGMLRDSSGIGIRDKPDTGTQTLRLDVAGQPLRAVRELLAIPILNPVMLASFIAVIAVVELHELKTIRLQVFREPIGVADDVRFGHGLVVTGPTGPDHRRTG